jgi:hypothetical protein
VPHTVCVSVSRRIRGKSCSKEIAPEGWTESTLQFVFHLTVEQVHWEPVRLHRNLQNLACFPNDRLNEPQLTLESVRAV